MTAPAPAPTQAVLPDQDDPAIGHELIRVTFEDGSIEELRLHDYERLYALPGVYEQIVQDRLGCVSPTRVAGMLAAAVDRVGWSRDTVRVLDVAAGNGVSGEALAAEGVDPILGTDIVAIAREAALRDRPGLYDLYLTLDLLDLDEPARRTLHGLQANALTCVAPVGDVDGTVPVAALTTAVGLLAPDALVAYLYDPARAPQDAVTPERWRSELRADVDVDVTELARERYAHRRTYSGGVYEMEAAVWRVRQGVAEDAVAGP